MPEWSEIVWTGNDLDVSVYQDDGKGVRPGEDINQAITLLTYCLFQDATISSVTPSERKPVWGRPRQRIVLGAPEYEMDVSYFHITATPYELANIFNREKCLQLEWKLQFANRIERHTLKIAYAISYQLVANDNQNCVGHAHFEAEEYEVKNV